MKCTIPEISWHNREPVLSIDIQPQSEDFFRLATGGADCHLLIWQLNICDNGAAKLEALSDLTRHQRAVNCVRWSPCGQYLASADDDANIIIWQLKTDNIPLLDGDTNDKETWIVYKVMRGHKEDIYDLSWAPNGQKLLSGSVDNTAILWDFTSGRSDVILKEHKGFVQGVCWDPKGHYFATISTDRICRIYEGTGKQVKSRIHRGLLPVPNDHFLYNKEVKYFHDDTFKSFFRRFDFSPDGSLLVVPSGRVEIEDCKKIFFGTYIFAVDTWAEPIAVFPATKQCSTVARFCPVLFELRDNGPESVISLPFRMIIAIALDHDVVLYDTQQLQPFAYFKDIHYTRLTDLTWSKNGLVLVASSTDGYCALITFEPNELGVEYITEESAIEESVMDVSGCEDLEKDEVEIVKPKRPSLLEKWTIKTPKKIKDSELSSKTEISSTDKKDERKANMKRIKPIPVLQTETNSNTSKTKDINASPLLKFMKAIPKDKTSKLETKNDCCITPSIEVLDENEARDAWPCEKDRTVLIHQSEPMETGEYTEDFSLHLDDTSCSTQSKNNIRQDESNHTIQQPNTDIDICKNIETIEKDNKSDVENKQLPDKNEGCDEIQNSENVVATDNCIVKPKRRIPLITLSSPRHKKKSET